ncbi:protein-disulfide reductase DsbD family protein [Glacieibacterium sp.]|uniref:protein-disulfide reductase DsbD family protein n=1 Tax=Glacieibacterium sp. TaxID=2860237 RepID=UPI003AFFD495
MIRVLLALLALLSLTPAAAQLPRHVAVILAAESAKPAAGKPLTLALTFTPQPGWHTYWKNPGDAGVETKATWTLPPGSTASDLRYPVPGTLLVSGLMNYVYERPATLLVDIAVPAGASGSFPIAVKLDYLVCTSELCVPESATATAQLQIGDGAPDPGAATVLAAARQAMPVPLDAAGTYRISGGRLAVAVPIADAGRVRSAYFFPAVDGFADYAAPQVLSVSGDSLRLETKASGTPSGPLTGILRIQREGESQPRGFAITANPGAVPAAGVIKAGDTNDSAGWRGFIPAFLLAVVGGVILNVMPCVFPILSLKALSLAKGGTSASDARRDAVAYAGGVMLVCVALGAAILGLRAAGTQIGWAFQLQNPHVILALLLLVTAIALNLAGLFEISLSSGGAGQSLTMKRGAAGSFWTGALAAFVATPCTGPFMAGALGAALVLPPLAGLLVFAGLGLGLALPFIAIGFVPALRRRLPKPGAWMATLRHILSVPMFLTALALAWVLGRQTGVGGMTLGLGGALLVALALWWFGARQQGQRPGWLPLGGAVVAAVLALIVLPPVAGATPVIDAPSTLAAEPFTEARLAALQAAKTPTLVYFTADWCLTCKVNERGALANAEVGRTFAAKGVKTLVGDWTNGDPVLGRFIEAHNRAGVPLYLFYHADGRVETLPQVLTPSRLIGLV